MNTPDSKWTNPAAVMRARITGNEPSCYLCAHRNKDWEAISPGDRHFCAKLIADPYPNNPYIRDQVCPEFSDGH